MIKVVTHRPEYFENFGWYEFATVEDSLQYFEDKDHAQFDIETTGLSCRWHKIHCIQLGDFDNQFVIDTPTVDIRHYKTLLETKLLYIQNANFERSWMMEAGIIIPLKTVIDTSTTEQKLTMGMVQEKSNLKVLGKKYLGIDLDKTQQLTIIDRGLDCIEHVEYSALDVKYLKSIHDKQKKAIKKQDLELAVQQENEFSMVLAYIEWCGIYRNPDIAYKLQRLYEYEEYGALLKLEKYFAKKYPDLAESYTDTNWGSADQVKAIFESIGINVTDKTGKRTVDIGFLQDQAAEFKIIQHYKHFKEKNKLVTTYGRKWDKYVHPVTKRIHSKFRPIQETGRTSSGSVKSGPYPNLQNAPNPGEDVPLQNTFRYSFVGQGPNVLITADYSSQESVNLADISGEKKMIKFYKSGGADLHSFAVQQMYPKLKKLSLKEIKAKHGDKRQAAKVLNFAIAYGGTARTLSEKLGISLDEAERIYADYMIAFPDLKKYLDEQKYEGIRNGYILIPDKYKAKRYIYQWEELAEKAENLDRLPRDEQWKVKGQLGAVQRNSLNTPCQGMAANQTKQAGIYFMEELIKHKWWGKVKIVNEVHDEYVVECHQRTAPKVAPVLEECMRRAANETLKHLEMGVSVSIKKYWDK